MTREEHNRRKYTNQSDYMDLELHRLRMRQIRRDQELERKKAKRMKILDMFSYFILIICMISVAMVDSESFIPAIVFFLTLVCLTVYAAWKGVLR